MEKNINSMSIELKFHNVKGKNYKFAIPKLNKEIVPEQSKVLVKPTRVVITLVKASKGNWLDLHYKEDKVILKCCFYLITLSLFQQLRFLFVHPCSAVQAKFRQGKGSYGWYYGSYEGIFDFFFFFVILENSDLFCSPI